MTETLRPLGWAGPTGVLITKHLRYVAPTDNRRGKGQTIVSGTAEVYTWPKAEDGWSGAEINLPHGLDLFPKGVAARFLVMDREAGTSTLYFVCSYHPEKRNIQLKSEFLLNVFDPEIMGPRTLYTLFVTKSDALEVRL